MRNVIAFFFGFCAVSILHAAEIKLTREQAAEVGRKIWENECGGTIEGLTSWNSGEDFASLGIGHFIWYPRGKTGPFDESFPKLVAFMASRGVKLPQLVLRETDCPWDSKREFQRDLNKPEVRELRQFLADNIILQTEFIAQRLEDSLPKMLNKSSEKPEVSGRFYRLASSSRGLFALIDYVNFKGEGVLDSEKYEGEGWGLLQVLENMRDTSSPVEEFSRSAKSVLQKRVQNAPGNRGEERWLAGWKNRVDSY